MPYILYVVIIFKHFFYVVCIAVIIDFICIIIYDLYQTVLYCFSSTPVAAGENSHKGEQHDDDERCGKPDGNFQSDG